MNADRAKIMATRSLEEAVKELFGLDSNGRICIFNQEAMTGSVASEYDELGKSERQETYKRLAEDFKRRTECYGINHPATSMNVGSIIEVGCGSGLLTLELAEQTNGDIIGLDLSEDMLHLAKENLTRRSNKKVEEIKTFWKRIPEYCKPTDKEHQKVDETPPLLDRIRFVKGSVYDLQSTLTDLYHADYIVCRNVLHRFQHPEKALKQMYQTLSPNGKLYLRDLRRDANWQNILERIGEKRWQTQTLVEDYIKAMAGMFTIRELEETLKYLGITNFKITDGVYVGGVIKNQDNIKEYEKETEYVCIIQK